MVFHSRLLVAPAVLVALCSSSMLRSEPKTQQVHQQAVETKSQIVVPNKTADTETKSNATATKAKPQDDAETLEALGKGLKTIHNLRALFAKDSSSALADGAEKFANGALSEELSKKDSKVWSTIETMIGATQDAMKAIKDKNSSERADVMKALEGKLDEKAQDLGNVSEDVSKKQQQQDEEYVLGLLLLHRDNWSMEKQLNATQQFMHNSPLLQKLFAHHDASKPLAPQLAAMMDVKNKEGEARAKQYAASIVAAASKHTQTGKVTQAVAKPEQKASKKVAVKKAASSAARALFLQLASTILSRDCPYCVAQCVDKCHTDGKPYVQCLTDCADAGK